MNFIIHDDFMLQTATARRLYHEYAKDLPIIDYHCHLSPQELAEDGNFTNLTKVWLEGDHYKWRAMRANGIKENYITGGASDTEKFNHWAKTVPYTLRNPLFHWTHLELKRYFDVEEYLTPDSAAKIYAACNERLLLPEYSARKLPLRMGVEMIGTTDDPLDDLAAHAQLREEGYEVQVLPTFRPDNLLKIEQTDFFQSYVRRLEEVSDYAITTIGDLWTAMERRIDYFHKMGCRLSDHGLPHLYGEEVEEHEADRIFQKVYQQGKNCEDSEAHKFKAFLLECLGKAYHQRGWTQQFHLGPIRDNNTRLLQQAGGDCGVDSIGDFPQALAMTKFFDKLDRENRLAKTIIYNLNPADNEVFATMIGNFQDGEIAGKIQWGSGWWFLDQKGGMERQLNTLSQMGLLSRFVGMLTDSRSFLSYPRHEYFRRTLCNLLGKDIDEGLLPNDLNWIGGMVKDICYYNAKNYFDFSSALTAQTQGGFVHNV
ncbi:glucuronate isomerase [Algivirga pacifica]|uniref:Uronate isomerase n=1 Tax=Algivirga pacifica TaxID=1162670 RepID=A0ABP9D2T1_9BACT